MFVPTPATTAPDTVDVGDVAGKITLFIDPGSTGPPEARAARSGARRPAPHPPACTCLVPVRYPRAAVIGSRFTHEARARSTRTKHAHEARGAKPGNRRPGGWRAVGARSSIPPKCPPPRVRVPRAPAISVCGRFGSRSTHEARARSTRAQARQPVAGWLAGRSELGARSSIPPESPPPRVRLPRARAISACGHCGVTGHARSTRTEHAGPKPGNRDRPGQAYRQETAPDAIFIGPG